MDTRYQPGKTEAKWYDFWMKQGYFAPKHREGKPFAIVMPPPNITGPLTMGHVLNMSLQDAFMRWHMVNGEECLWLPGQDHAGIATQNAVERQLAKEKLTRHDVGREKFTERVWEWKGLMSDKITQQIQHLGCACDWNRERFTMDEGLTRAVRTAFVTLFKQGLIYRGEYVVNSCPRCLTTLADDEVERRQVKGKLYYVKYPFEGGGHLTVATTRPETMLGDVAVAVNPGDERYMASHGKVLVLPIIGRKMPLITDDFVDPEFGTGAVKVTPAHDADDFDIGQRHRLETVVVIDPSGVMNDNAGEYKGLDRFEARKQIVERLQREGLLEKVDDYDLSVGRCYRCATPVEPLLSNQYFVKMKDLAEPALEAVRSGKVRFHPEKWVKVYYNWLDGIRDWCISRQLWWGHRIPIWHCEACGQMTSELSDPTECPSCGGKVRQEEDVLDTWFSSWLWPFSTLGWPDEAEDLERYYPTSVLVTGPDIIFFWVARMIMAGLSFRGDIPFEDVYFHGMIRDETGRKMSKSLGNSPDPSDLIGEYGADALRFTMISLTPRGGDILFSEKQVHIGRNFANKVWNAARLVSAASEKAGFEGGSSADKEPALELSDRWIISRAAGVTRTVSTYFEKFELNQAAKAIYDFFWHEVCDWYLEMAKERFYSEDAAARDGALTVVRSVLARSLRLLHPFMPFLTDEVWTVLSLGKQSLLDGGGVDEVEFKDDPLAERTMAMLTGIVEMVRNIRGEMGIHPSAGVPLYLKFSAGGTEKDAILAARSYIFKMAKVTGLFEGEVPEAEGPVATGIVENVEVAVPLGDVIDVDVEKARLEKEIERIEQLLARSRAKIDNPEFTNKAPAKIVEREREKIGQLAENAAKLKKNLSVLLGS